MATKKPAAKAAATNSATTTAKKPAKASGDGTKAKPWKLKTPPGTTDHQMYRAEDADPPAIVCVVGTTELRYHLSATRDLHAMLKKHGDWMPLGSADEQKPAADGTVEAWGRSSKNPGWTPRTTACERSRVALRFRCVQ